jgi:hypothetical protein
MVKSATDVMHDIIVSAVIDSVMALRAASGGLPNSLLRELNAIHANTTFADLPKEVQDGIAASVRSAFTRLLREGYSVSSGSAPPERAAPPRREGFNRPPPRKPGGDRPTENRRPGAGRPGDRKPGDRKPPDRSPRGPGGPGAPGGKPPRGPRSR